MRRVRYRFKRVPGHWGVAYPDQWRIEIDPSLDDKTLIEITTHEIAHVVLPVLDETAVDTLGKHVADVLYRMGFRRTDGDD